MKTKKFLSLLLFLPLVTGCGVNVKAPKFADYGKEIKVDKFTENFEKKFQKSIFGKNKLDSLEFSRKHSYEESWEQIRNDKKYGYDIEKGVDTYKFSYDAKNLIAKTEQKTVEEINEKRKDYEEDYALEDKINMLMQLEKINKTLFLVQIDKDAKQYEPYLSIPDEKQKKLICDSLILDLMGYLYLDEFYDLLDDYDDGSSEEKKCYTFYQNENIFTIEYEYEGEYTDKDADEKVIYVEETHYKKISQLEIGEKEWKMRFSSEWSYDTEYSQSAYGYAEGDKSAEKGVVYTEFEGKLKDVSLKKEDLSKYTALGFKA